jgi:TRAP-type C4-dicarboxylate transport system permease small subunit
MLITHLFMKSVRFAEKAFDRLVDWSFWTAAVLLLFLAFIVGYEVLMRHVFNAPTIWVLQTGKYCLVFITFFSVTKILQEDGHTRMSIITEILPDRILRYLNRMTSLLAAVIAGFMTWRTGLATYEAYQWDLNILEGYSIPQEYVWWAMPFGFGCLTIQLLRNLFGYKFQTPVRDL